MPCAGVECSIVTRTIAKGIAAAASLAATLSAAAGQVPTFRGGVDLVNLGVTVLDKKGSFITDLKPDEFEVFEDGKKQQVRYFTSGAATDAGGPETHLGLLIDVSESMGEDISF